MADINLCSKCKWHRYSLWDCENRCVHKDATTKDFIHGLVYCKDQNKNGKCPLWEERPPAPPPPKPESEKAVCSECKFFVGTENKLSDFDRCCFPEFRRRDYITGAFSPCREFNSKGDCREFTRKPKHNIIARLFCR